MTQNEKELERQKALKILKASNEMLMDARKNIMKQKKLTEEQKKEEINKIEKAIDENRAKGRNLLNADDEMIESVQYNMVNESEKLKYDEYRKKRGITDDQLRQKDMATQETVATVGKKDNIVKKQRRRKKTSTENDGIVRVLNEEELMKQSMVKSDSDLYNSISLRQKENLSLLQKATDARKVNDNIDRQVSNDIEQEAEKEENRDIITYDFDFSSIPDYVQYDVIPLPSKGECYAHHIGRVPVAFLTAADENIIASPNMYRDGKVIDVILERKILDKRIKVDELCEGDRDAIVLWLRATGYGNNFPIIATHPDTGKRYNLDIDLSTIKFTNFGLKGDKEGHFTYKSENGDIIKFKYLSKKEDDKERKKMIEDKIKLSSYELVNYASKLQEIANDITNIKEDDKKDLNDCVADIKDIVAENVKIDDDDVNVGYNEIITDQMKAYTISINGNVQREFIKNYIDNMRASDAYKYRQYVNNNKPGLDYKITINVPESDGGGSFDTFLDIDDTIFINI